MLRDVCWEEQRRDLAELLPWPVPDCNKYTRGRLLIVAGSAAYPGAAVLAAKAAARSGAGYVSLAIPQEAAAYVRPNLITVPVRECESVDGVFSEDGALEVLSCCNNYDAVLFGPGVSVCDETADLLELLLLGCERPLLLDADALSLAARMPQLLARRQEAGLISILTPHDGESARLLAGLDGSAADASRPLRASDVEARAAAALQLSDAYAACVLCKGPVSCLAYQGRSWRFAAGSPALATAGSGDVLAGICGALLAQGLGAFDAACLAAALQGRAGVAAAARLTEICVNALDLIDFIPAAFIEIQEGKVE